MAYQTSYRDELAPGLPGRLVNMEVSNTISRIVEDSAGIGFGVPIFQGAADNGVSATGDVFRGVTVADPGRFEDTYTEGQTAGVLTTGVIWVVAGGTVSAGDPALYDGGWETGADALPGAVFDSSGGEGDLVKLRLGASVIINEAEGGEG